MKWSIPAKTFLIGEYAALEGEGAILLNTAPCFEATLIDNADLNDIHPLSPAGIWWQEQGFENKALSWNDPYHGQGGLGASSAEFIASYLASCHLKGEKPTQQQMLLNYYRCAWNGKGLRPSGYDLIAQSQQNSCVYISQKQNRVEALDWTFNDIGFLLLHSGKKLATHHHLQKANLQTTIKPLNLTVEQAKIALLNGNSEQLIEAINHFHHQLIQRNLVADHSLELINQLKRDKRILALKGCGAMGADVILLLTETHHLKALKEQFKSENLTPLASHTDLYQSSCFFENDSLQV